VDRSDDPDLSTTPVADNCTAATADDCSLRGAITKANKTTNDDDGPDEVRFNIPGAGPHTISPTSQLPTITDNVTVDGYKQPGAAANTATGNANNAVRKIEISGVDAEGNVDGLVVAGNTAGGTTIKGLVINGFSGDGVVISGSGATGNRIEGNFIGTNAAGTAALGNGAEGVGIFDGSDNQIGGTIAEARNVISGNDTDGVEINAGSNRVEGNLVGTSVSGAAALGNGEVGVLIRSSGNVIGGTESGTRNVISGNHGVGVSMLGTDASGNTIQGNLIGTQVNGTTPLSNFHGVFISDASGNLLGGTDSAAANTISGNANNGVSILDATATGNRILRNSIFDNGTPGGLGIELNNDGPTTNDAGDPDTGPNLLQNFPDLASVSVSSGGQVTITGNLNSNPSSIIKKKKKKGKKKKRRRLIPQVYTLQFFSNPAPNFPTGFGEGQRFIGETTVVTNLAGNAPINLTFTLEQAMSTGEFVAATATRNATGDTSEFSQARVVQ
jgi:hypothetical protein